MRRWGAKAAILALVTLVVLYPKPWLLATWFSRIGDLVHALDPAHPGLAPLEERVRASLSAKAPPEEVLRLVQQTVHERIPYGWDWDVWGVAEYLPTVDEALRMGREDCDGRAVVAASLLRRMGYDAWLVSDVLHMWVETPQGETMNPTGGDKTLVGRRQGTEAAGTQWNVTLGFAQNLARAASFGIAVFPLARELIILVTICLLALQPHSSLLRRLLGCALLGLALSLIRDAGRAAAMAGEFFDVAKAIAGFGLAIVGWLTLVIRGAGPPPRSAATLSE